MNILLKWVITDMMTWINHSILLAVSQLDANGSVTKHVKNAAI